jgi:hypothetical protein
VSTQGSPYGRFHGALDRGNTLAALSAAAELDHVGLVDALELRLLARDGPGGDFGFPRVRHVSPPTSARLERLGDFAWQSWRRACGH